jgi:hypothetical protein
MSADNGLSLRKVSSKVYSLSEYNASTGFNYWYEEYSTLLKAIEAAQKYMEENDVEYGLQLNI